MYKLCISAFLLVFSASLLFSQTDPSLASGLAKQKEGKNDLAIVDFSDAIKKHETEVQDFLKKWDDYSKVSVFDRAEKGIEAPPIEKAFAAAYYLRGVSNVAVHKNDDAMSDFNTAIKINPGSGAAYYERGKILFANGKKYEACCDLGLARSLGDSLAKEMFDEKFCWNEALLYYKDALSKLKMNQYEEALDLIQRSINLCPDSVRLLIVRGKCYTGMGKLDLAFTDFDKVIAALPDNYDAYFGRGLAFYNKRKYEESFRDLDKSIHLYEGFADAYLYRAYVCEGMNKVQSAIYDYQQVQRLKPNDALAFYKSGLLKNDNGDPKGACADFRKATALGSADASDYLKSCK